MTSFWKAVAIVLCVAVIGLGIAWRIYETQVDERNQTEVTRNRRVSAEKGDARAQTDLAIIYSHGQGVPQDYAEAVRWYRKAADQGDARAQAGLAFMYSHGQGAPQDYAEAVLLYSKAADQGNSAGQHGLGSLYYYGHGLPQDYGEAVRWYRKAAEQGDAVGQSDLGFMYSQGKGVPRDRAKALRWYRKAADQGDENALRAISAPITVPRGFALLVRFLAGLWLLSIFPFKYLVSGMSLRSFRERLITVVGILIVFSAGLGLYGYSHHEIRCLKCGFATFTLFRWLLDAVVIALLVYIFRGRKIERPQDGSGSSDVAITR